MAKDEPSLWSAILHPPTLLLVLVNGPVIV